MNTLSMDHEISVPNTTDALLTDTSVNDAQAEMSRRSVSSDKPNVFTDIYDDNINIAVWQRTLSNELNASVNSLLASSVKTSSVLAVSPQNCKEVLQERFGNDEAMSALSDDISLLVDMFCCLFELKGAGLRLTILDRPMCPRFHFDRIPCRLVTTYQGVATQWLENDVVDRSKLGAGNQGKPDEDSGLFKSLGDIEQLRQGDVALLKGEHWDEKEGGGLVHRSPAVSVGEKRLLLTLDFIDD